MPTLAPPPPLTRRILRPPPSVSEAFSQALPWLLGSVAMTLAALIGQVPPWALLTFTACTAWRYLVEVRGWPMPTFSVRLLVFVPMTLAVVWTYGTHLTAAAMLTFLVALISLKILELRTPRDFTVVSLLGYFMALSAFFYNQSLLLSLYLVVALVANTVSLIRSHSGNGQASIASTFRIATVMILQALPLMALLFVIFPRVQGNFLHRLSGDPQGLTGMSEHLQPGSFSSLAQSTETAFRAKIVSGGAQLTSSQLYWRGLVMDICEHGLSWRASEVGTADSPKVPHAPTGRRVEQLITLKPQGERWLFALDHPVEGRPAAGAHLALTTNDVLRSTIPVVSGMSYTAISELSAPGPIQDSLGRRYTLLPRDVSPRVIALAQGWRKQARNDEDVMRLALQFFRDGHFTYTLNPGRLPTESALDTFLFKSRAGFCEHYAAAFCVLMRAAGLPARVVVGYQGGEYNTWGGHYVVRQSDAHAWAEVWLPGRGWQRADPTGMVAPDRVSFGADDYSTLIADGPLTEESRLERLRRLKTPTMLRWVAHNALLAWDGLDQKWNTMVLGYDQEQQWVFLQKIGVGNLDWLGGTALTLVAVFSVLSLGTFLFRVSERGNSSRSRDVEQKLYRRFCRRLARAGLLPRAESEGPLDFASRAAASLPHAAEEIRGITRLYVALRYGAPSSAADALGLVAKLRTAVAAFRPKRANP